MNDPLTKIYLCEDHFSDICFSSTLKRRLSMVAAPSIFVSQIKEPTTLGNNKLQPTANSNNNSTLCSSFLNVNSKGEINNSVTCKSTSTPTAIKVKKRSKEIGVLK